MRDHKQFWEGPRRTRDPTKPGIQEESGFRTLSTHLPDSPASIRKCEAAFREDKQADYSPPSSTKHVPIEANRESEKRLRVNPVACGYMQSYRGKHYFMASQVGSGRGEMRWAALTEELGRAEEGSSINSHGPTVPNGVKLSAHLRRKTLDHPGPRGSSGKLVRAELNAIPTVPFSPGAATRASDCCSCSCTSTPTGWFCRRLLCWGRRVRSMTSMRRVRPPRTD